MVRFGEYVRELRLQARLTLREFCKILDLDPSNWSKVERGILPPPKSREVLKEIATTVKIKDGSEAWHKLFDLVLISHIPSDLMEEPKVLEKLPVFFRTLRGQKPTEKELRELIKIIKED